MKESAIPRPHSERHAKILWEPGHLAREVVSGEALTKPFVDTIFSAVQSAFV
jgi:hypothetical protein